MKYLNCKFLTLAVFALSLCRVSVAQNDNEFHLDETYPMSQTGKLWMDPEDAEVTIIGSKRSDVRIKVDRIEDVKALTSSSRKFSVDVDVKGGDIFFKEREDNGGYFIGSVSLDYKILIELPENASIIVRSDDSDFKVVNVNGSIDMSLDDGDAQLTQCSGDRFDFDMDDGDISLDGGRGEIYARIDDGDITITRGAFDDVEIRSDDGSISLETSLSDNGTYQLFGDDARIELTILSGGGDIIIDGDDTSIRATGDFREVDSSESRSVYSLPNGKARVKIRTDDGRVRIQTSSRKL
ncbi:MAG: DUF4097 family beta strand repeat-containing protein [Cyclobacteriaceae bacterium]